MPNNGSFAARFQGPKGQEDMPYLLTPGPVTTSRAVKLAMLADYATHDHEFVRLTAAVQQALLNLSGAANQHECVLLQGPGMFAVEAALGSFTPQRRKKTLVLANGKHGQMAHQIMLNLGRNVILLERDQGTVFSSGDVDEALVNDADITHVWAVHCEASSGIENPIADIAALVKAKGKVMMVDAIASFGAMTFDVSANIDVVVATSGNCLESVPGISFVIADRTMLLAAQGKSHSLVLDLHANWQTFAETGLFRLTPSTHALSALAEALRELDQQGGIVARLARYQANAAALLLRMKAMGFIPFLQDAKAGALVQTFFAPRDSNYDFENFFKALRKRGFVITPGALTTQQSFRVATMGAVDERVIENFAAAVAEFLLEQNIRELRPL